MESRRVPYFDWLRVLAVAGDVVFHAVLPFANVGWWISNVSGSDALKAIVPLARFVQAKKSMPAFLKE